MGEEGRETEVQSALYGGIVFSRVCSVFRFRKVSCSSCGSKKKKKTQIGKPDQYYPAGSPRWPGWVYAASSSIPEKLHVCQHLSTGQRKEALCSRQADWLSKHIQTQVFCSQETCISAGTSLSPRAVMSGAIVDVHVGAPTPHHTSASPNSNPSTKRRHGRYGGHARRPWSHVIRNGLP